MMLDPSVRLNEIDASLQKLSIGNQKCDNEEEDKGDMIPMCGPCFAGNAKNRRKLIVTQNHWFEISNLFEDKIIVLGPGWTSQHCIFYSCNDTFTLPCDKYHDTRLL